MLIMIEIIGSCHTMAQVPNQTVSHTSILLDKFKKWQLARQ